MAIPDPATRGVSGFNWLTVAKLFVPSALGILIFFIAPFCALVVGIVYWILHRNPEIPYGPFLCLAAMVLIVKWAAIWNWAEPLFALGWRLLAVLAAWLAARWAGELPAQPYASSSAPTARSGSCRITS